MLAVHLENRRVTLKRKPRPRRREGFALLRLLAGGICNTDLELLRGYYGFRGTPGHEFTAEVVEADNRALIGQRVVGEINLACGRCDWCRRDLGRHCPSRTVLGIVRHPGAFSEFFTLPERNLHILPPEIPTEHGVFVEPLAAACEILEQVAIPRSARVAVLGDGKLGLLAAQVLQVHGAEVHLYGRHPQKLALARGLGIETHRTERRPRAAYDWVVEATGAPEGLVQAVTMVRPRGAVVLKSTTHRAVRMDTAPVVVNEVTLVGSRCGRFQPALELLRSGAVRVDRMIADRFPLTRARQAFARAAAPGVLKVLLIAGEAR
ncbi:MAG: alcohol dehydrogenase catalytic domain-containing protein [Bryobacterales bacterium]|nr:alcohol dehydrogenase catalytic domain-containing protein [Bryobacteraceae bacterium]MDW8354951.1 alcohol dehydrogenase catalytic domain-containing protein [Bryobacterales bacterium]